MMNFIQEEINENNPLIFNDENNFINDNNSDDDNDQTHLICELTPADFDIFIRILDIITKENKDSMVVIRKSILKRTILETFLQADLKPIFNIPVNIDIINPRKYLQLFKLFKNDKNIIFKKNDKEQSIIVSNNEIIVNLPQIDEESFFDFGDIDFTNASVILKTIIDKPTIKKIKNIEKNADTVDLLIKDEKLKGILTSENGFPIATYIFSDHQNESNINIENSDLALRSANFIPIDSDEIELSIVKTINTGYVIITRCTIGGKVDVFITEICNESITDSVSISSII
jgi:hypothetical protein